MTEATPTPEQLASLRERWSHNPYAYRELFDGTRAVPVSSLLAHLERHGLTHALAIGWLATMTQVGHLQMISSDLVNLGPRAQPLPNWVEEPKSED